MSKPSFSSVVLMSRNEGFGVADVSSAKLSDPKFKALWRYLRDEQAMNAAVVLHDATLLASWQHGERVTADDAAPAWVTDIDAPAKALIHVGLLDSDRLIPDEAWREWFGSASDRRQNLRDKWQKANRNRRNTKDTPRSHSGDNGGTAAPVRPSSPLNSSVTPFPVRGEKIGFKEPDEEKIAAVARAQAVLDDPNASEDRKEGARYALDRLRA